MRFDESTTFNRGSNVGQERTDRATTLPIQPYVANVWVHQLPSSPLDAATTRRYHLLTDSRPVRPYDHLFASSVCVYDVPTNCQTSPISVATLVELHNKQACFLQNQALSNNHNQSWHALSKITQNFPIDSELLSEWWDKWKKTLGQAPLPVVLDAISAQLNRSDAATFEEALTKSRTMDRAIGYYDQQQLNRKGSSAAQRLDTLFSFTPNAAPTFIDLWNQGLLLATLMYPGNKYHKQAHEVLSRIQKVMRSRPFLVSYVHPIDTLISKYHHSDLGQLLDEVPTDQFRELSEGEWRVFQREVTRVLMQIDSTIDSLRKNRVQHNHAQPHASPQPQPQQQPRRRNQTAIVNIEDWPEFDLDDDQQSVTESLEDCEGVFDHAQQICALFQKKRSPANHNSSAEMKPISLNNPPRRFKDWFSPLVFQKLIEDVDDPLLKEWLSIIIVTGTLKATASTTTEYANAKSRLQKLQEEHPDLTERLTGSRRPRNPSN